MDDFIYMDHAATTPVRPEVREAMAPYLERRFGNPSSIHRAGREARAALEEARERVAAVIGAERREIVFTSGGTEADNIAVLGRWRWTRSGGRTGPVVCSAVEHRAVLGAVDAAAREGADPVVLGVDPQGRVDPAELGEALASTEAAPPSVVSVMWGNNEVGVLQPVRELADRCRGAGVAFHSDAVQALGKVPVRMDEVPCDLLSVNAHKLGGPKGIGALFVRDGVELEPLVHGGGQERAVRPGTQNVAAAVGLATAAELAVEALETERTRLTRLRERMEAALAERLPGLAVHAGSAERLPHVLNVSVPGADQEALLMALDMEGLGVSSGSACQSGSVEPSHVLTAMGRTAEAGGAGGGEDGRPAASVRLSLGWSSTEDEIEHAIECVPRIVRRVRELASV